MKYSQLFITSLAVSILLAAAPSQYVNAQEKNTVEKVENTKEEKIVVEQELPKVFTGQPFIDLISEPAMKIGADQGIYASVMIAQAVLESNYGKSALSQSPSNNLFGIKGKYKGQGKSFKTSEDNGSGSLFQINSKFRIYNSYNESLNDYASLITNGLSYNSGYYAGAWKVNATNYREAANYLEGRYATDTNYAGKLIHLIEKYDLTRFDVDEYAYYIADKVVKVVEGDTLQKLAATYKTTVEDIKKWNNLESNVILIGQQLVVTIKKIDEVPTVQGKTGNSTQNITEKETSDTPVTKTKIEVEEVEKASKPTKQEKKKVIQAAKKPETVIKELKPKVKVKKEVLEKVPATKVEQPKKKKIVYIATKYYKVQEGDSLTSIAERHNITSEQLKKWNKLTDATIKMGQKLIVDVKGSKKVERSVKSQSRYVIQQGDSLADIASNFQTTEQKLMELNHLDSSFVYDGQIIYIKK